MPPPWSSRLLSTNTSNLPPSRGSPNPAQQDRPPPRPQQEFPETPTLNPDRTTLSTSRPQSSGNRGHSHNRSVSHPLPKIFGRNKSSGNLKHNDSDVPLDDTLVPVLDEPSKHRTPMKVISGKKNKASESSKTERRCMCCDSKVNVPKELQKFRCLNCLTVNDLKPIEQQSDEESSRPKARRAGTYPADVPSLARIAISVERTKAIIDQCVISYLETRCRTQQDLSGVSLQPRHVQAAETAYEHANSLSPSKLQATDDGRAPVSQAIVFPSERSAVSPFDAFAADSPDLSLTLGTATLRPSELSPPGHQRVGIIPRKPVPAPPSRRPPLPPADTETRPQSRRYNSNTNLTSSGRTPPPFSTSPQRPEVKESEDQKLYERRKKIFKPLEDYMIATFGDLQCLGSSFSMIRPPAVGRTRSEGILPTPAADFATEHLSKNDESVFELDEKLLLLGDIGENGSWWTGKHDRARQERDLKRSKEVEAPRKTVSSKSPNIDWPCLSAWYSLVHSAGVGWQTKIDSIQTVDPNSARARLEGLSNRREIEDDLQEARDHAIRSLLKITENLLKRPTRPLKDPEDIRFLLILLSNPSLYPSHSRNSSGANRHLDRPNPDQPVNYARRSPTKRNANETSTRESSQHTGLLKRIFGLIAHSSDACHRYMIGWLSRFDEAQFIAIVDLVASFVTHRIGRRTTREKRKSIVDDGGLIPDLSGSAMNTSAQLHSAMGLSGSIKKAPENPNAEPNWAGDWQIKGAAKFMSLLFSANNTWQGKRRDGSASRIESPTNSSSQAKARRSGQLLHTSDFYNTLLDYQDMIMDYKIWESKRDKFAFCQYPLFLSMGTKIKILEYDARRQMEVKAREAYFDQVMRQRANDGNLHLRVRRECLVDDSLRQISEAVGSGQEELKKGLRVHFTGEEGVDAGGPRKEWFLMLIRDVFDPNHGMFIYDDDSHTCYFNPNTFETSDQYYLVGALLGLAIYNSTILDVAFPPFAFRKLLAAAPSSVTNFTNLSSLTGTKGQMTYTLADLAEFRPSLAAGLQQLLDYDGDVETTYCWDFVAPVERYGTVANIPLMPRGDKTPVTNANRQQFVDAYVRYLLDTAVARQFEPFKRGFFTVCAGNALSLFRAEEIELLVRGSDEQLDVNSLRAVAVHENWRDPRTPHGLVPHPEDSVPVVIWFWKIFAVASPERQRKLLIFITGSDRIPAVGATSLVLRIVAGGDGFGGGGAVERARYPVARTCFNMLVLWFYESQKQLEERLWRAVDESEGFGLK